MLKNILYFVLILIICPMVFGQSVEYHGVCVGINDYPGTINDLSWSVADAQVIQQRLIAYQGWLSGNITVLTDAQAYKSNILSKISAMPRSSGYTDLFQYTGHGDNIGLWVVDEVDLRPSELQAEFGGSYNQYCVFLNTCESGIFPSNMTTGVITSSCQSNELSYEDGSLQHGIYSYFVIQGLTNNTAGNNGLISAEQVYNYAAPLTTNYESSMHPQITDNYSGDLILNWNIYVPQQYSTLTSALSAAVSGQTVIVTGNTSLSANGAVPSGVTLIINSGATVNFNGCYIDATNGTINIQNGCTVCLTNGGARYFGLFTYIGSALSAASSGQTVLVLSGNYTFTSNVSIPNGVTLQIGSAATLQIGSAVTMSFGSGALLTCNGVLNANSATFTSNGGSSPGSWGSIILDGSTTSSSVLDNITMQYGTDIQFLNGSQATLEYSTLQYNTRGVYIYDAGPFILNNSILEVQERGIRCLTSGYYSVIGNNVIIKTGNNPYYKNYEGINICDWAYGLVYHNDINGFCWGIYIGGSSGAFFTDYNWDYINVNNCIRYCIYGLGVGWGAEVDMSFNNGRNSIYNNDSYDLYVYESSQLWDVYNYYGGGNPNQYVDGTSFIYTYGSPLTSDPWGGLGKIASTSNGTKTQSIKALSTQPSSGGDDIKEFQKGIDYERQKDFTKAIEQFKQMVTSGILAKMALTELARIANQTANLDLITYFESLKDTKTQYQPDVLRLLSGMYMRQGEKEKSAALFDDIINKFPDTRDEREAWFQKFYYALHVQKDKTAATTILDNIKTKYSNDDPEGDIDFAESILNPSLNSIKGASEKTKKIVTDEIQVPKEFAISQNYPNPFNPSTLISYQLPNGGTQYIVSLRVYDMLGRVVATLVDGSKEAGTYTANFDGSHLASGMYFARFIATPQDGSKPFNQTMKMLMMK